MNYNELSKELGINSGFVGQAEAAGLLPNSSQLPSLRSFEENEIVIIRRCALLKMLSFSWSEISEVNSGSKDFTTALSEHVTRIINDSENISQAAIVLQNIKREKEDFFSFDPVPYLQHINELKRNSGIFYDVNTSQLPYEGRTTSYSYGQDRSHSSGNGSGTGPAGQILWDYKDYRRPSDTPPNFGQPGYDYTQNTRRPASDIPENTSKQDSGARDDGSAKQEASSAEGAQSARQESEYQNSHTSREQHGYASFDSYGRPRIRSEVTCPHPVRRYIARITDGSIFTFLAYMLVEVGLKINLDDDILLLCFVTLLTYAVEFAVEPLLIAKFGTTVGKWIMGFSLRDNKTKDNLSVSASYKRIIRLIWYGMGAYLPVYGIIREVRSMLSCTRDEVLPWDNDIDYVMKDDGMWRIFVCLLTLAFLTKIEPIINYQTMIPENRGQITEAQFYENVNEVMSDMRYSGPVPAFEVTCLNGYADTVTLHFSAENGNINDSVEMIIAFRAFASCTTGSNGYTFSEDSTMYNLSLYYQNLNRTYLDVHVTNEVTDGLSSLSSGRTQMDMLSQLLMRPQVDHVFTLSKSK